MCNFFAFIKWLLPVLRLTEVTMTAGNSLRLAGKILVLVKLMALTIYAKADLLRPRPRTLPQGQGLAVARPRPQILALRPRPRPRTNINDLDLNGATPRRHSEK